MIYLDNHTTTRPFPETLERHRLFCQERWATSASYHPGGEQVIASLSQSAKTLSHVLQTGDDFRFQYVTSPEEAASKILFSTYLEVVREMGKNHLLVQSDTLPQEQLKSYEQLGCVIKPLVCNLQGQITPQQLAEAIGPKTALVSLSWAHPLTGVIQPLHDLAEVCREKGALLHVDLSSAIGKVFFRLQDLDATFLSFSGHLFHGLKGSGGLFVRHPSPVSALFHEPVAASLEPGFIALSDAIARSLSLFDHLSTEVARLRNKLEEGIVEKYPEATILFKEVERLPNCSVIAFPGVSAELLHYLLARKEIYAAPGLAAHLVASGFEPLVAHATLSFHLAYDTTEQEIDRAIEEIVLLAKKGRQLSRGIL